MCQTISRLFIFTDVTQQKNNKRIIQQNRFSHALSGKVQVPEVAPKTKSPFALKSSPVRANVWNPKIRSTDTSVQFLRAATWANANKIKGVNGGVVTGRSARPQACNLQLPTKCSLHQGIKGPNPLSVSEAQLLGLPDSDRLSMNSDTALSSSTKVEGYPFWCSLRNRKNHDTWVSQEPSSQFAAEPESFLRGFVDVYRHRVGLVVGPIEMGHQRGSIHFLPRPEHGTHG